MMETMFMILKKVKAPTIGQMEGSTRVIGLKVNNTVKDCTLTKRVNKERGHGLTVREQAGKIKMIKN